MSIIEKAIDRLVTEGEHPKQRAQAESQTKTVGALRGDSSVEALQRQALPPATGSAGPIQEPAPNAEGAVPAEEREGFLPINGLNLEAVISPQTERGRLAEEFRMIKRPLLQRAFPDEVAPGDHPNVIVVTSSVAGEGKTFISLNLAISIAMELDRTVLLADADLANPGLSRLLKAQDLPGMTERLLDGTIDLKDLLLRTDVPKLTLLPAGRRHRRSTELLASNAMKGLLDELATRYPDRVVLFDSPPLLATSEAGVLAEQAGQICLVVESATTPQFLVKESLGQLRRKDHVSLVLNKAKDELLSGRGGYYYGYRYGYGYGYGQGDAAA